MDEIHHQNPGYKNKTKHSVWTSKSNMVLVQYPYVYLLLFCSFVKNLHSSPAQTVYTYILRDQGPFLKTDTASFSKAMYVFEISDTVPYNDRVCKVYVYTWYWNRVIVTDPFMHDACGHSCKTMYKSLF